MCFFEVLSAPFAFGLLEEMNDSDWSAHPISASLGICSAHLGPEIYKYEKMYKRKKPTE
jgi:hypothetical protein